MATCTVRPPTAPVAKKARIERSRVKHSCHRVASASATIKPTLWRVHSYSSPTAPVYAAKASESKGAAGVRGSRTISQAEHHQVSPAWLRYCGWRWLGDLALSLAARSRAHGRGAALARGYTIHTSRLPHPSCHPTAPPYRSSRLLYRLSLMRRSVG